MKVHLRRTRMAMSGEFYAYDVLVPVTEIDRSQHNYHGVKRIDLKKHRAQQARGKDGSYCSNAAADQAQLCAGCQNQPPPMSYKWKPAPRAK